jgi:pimeloyl-ACP methyl ester carboxylesterase
VADFSAAAATTTTPYAATANVNTNNNNNNDLSRFSLLSIGRPGYLRSTTLPTLDAEIAAIIAFLDSLGIKRRVHVVARSLSATTALALAARYPDRVCSLTLVSAVLGPAMNRSIRRLASELFVYGTNCLSNLRAFQMHRIIAGMAAAIELLRRLMAHRNLHSKSPISDSALLDELNNHPETIQLYKHYEACVAWGGERRAGFWRDYRLLWRMDALRQAELMASIHVPILAFHGELDYRAPLALVQKALGIPEQHDHKNTEQVQPQQQQQQRQLIPFPGTGHMLPPMAVGRQALNYMQSMETR